MTPAATRRRRLLAASLLCACTLLPAQSAFAHARSVSYSRWEVDAEGVRVSARVSQLELTRLGILPSTPPEQTADYLANHLQLSSSQGPCAPRRLPVSRTAEEGFVSFTWSLSCPTLLGLRVHSSILLDVAPSHLHFARFRHGESPFVERVLTEAEPSWELPPDPGTPDAAGAPASGAGTSLAGYVALGVEHILSGWDHLAFVLALLLLAATLGEVASLVTAFTIAHSVTLGLAATGILHPDGAAVEAMIGFSIALVAAENCWLLGGRRNVVPLAMAALALGFAALAKVGVISGSFLGFVGLAMFAWCHFGLLERAQRPARLRAAVAFAFGLVHGFGFAGVLGEMELDRSRLLPALFGFNVGVEAGQLAVVALVWPMLRQLARLDSGLWHRRVAELGSAAICGLGLFWFVTRTF